MNLAIEFGATVLRSKRNYCCVVHGVLHWADHLVALRFRNESHDDCAFGYASAIPVAVYGWSPVGPFGLVLFYFLETCLVCMLGHEGADLRR